MSNVQRNYAIHQLNVHSMVVEKYSRKAQKLTCRPRRPRLIIFDMFAERPKKCEEQDNVNDREEVEDV